MHQKLLTTISTLTFAGSLSAVAVAGSASVGDLALASVAATSAFSLAGAFTSLGITGLLSAAPRGPERAGATAGSGAKPYADCASSACSAASCADRVGVMPYTAASPALNSLARPLRANARARVDGACNSTPAR